MNAVSTIALGTVFASMFALGAGFQMRWFTQEMPKPGLIARCLGVALVAVPAMAIILGPLLELKPGLLAGFLLIGISPGAPMALRRSQDSGGRVSFSMVLQVTVAVFAIFAVPAWVLILDALYGERAGIDILDVAKQVFLAQLLPLACGAACAIRFPLLAARVARPLLRASAVLLLVIVGLVLWQVGPKLPALGVAAFAASALLAASAIGLGHWAGGPAADTRTTSAILCAMRNPGIALLVASTNRLPETAKLVVIAHVLMTALLLFLYLALWRWRALVSPPKIEA